MARLPKQLFDELASLVELEDGTFAGLIEEADLHDGRVVLGNPMSDQAFGGFIVTRLEELHARGLIEYGAIIKIRDRGREVVEAAGGPDAQAPVRSDVLEALDHIDLHPAIDRRVRRAFEDNDPQPAVAAAFAAIETHVRLALREHGHPTPARAGAGLITDAIKPGGPLADPERPEAEQRGIVQLFQGAMAAVRNPNAHGEPRYEPAEALRLVLFADHLLRTIPDAPA